MTTPKDRQPSNARPADAWAAPAAGSWLEKTTVRLEGFVEELGMVSLDPVRTHRAYAEFVRERVADMAIQTGQTVAATQKQITGYVLKEWAKEFVVPLAAEKPGGDPFGDPVGVLIILAVWERSAMSLLFASRGIRAANAVFADSLVDVAAQAIGVTSREANGGLYGPKVMVAPLAAVRYVVRILGGAAEEVRHVGVGWNSISADSIADTLESDAELLGEMMTSEILAKSGSHPYPSHP